MRSLTATKVHDLAAPLTDVLGTLADTSTWLLWLGCRVAGQDVVLTGRHTLTLQDEHGSLEWEAHLSRWSLKLTSEDGQCHVIRVRALEHGTEATWTHTTNARVKRRSTLREDLEGMLFRLNATSLGRRA